MIEADVERYLLDQCRLLGFLCLKFVCPGRDGVPDRIVVSQSATVFVEIKKPGERPRRNQREMHAKLRRFGASVHVLDSRGEVDRFIRIMSRRALDLPTAG